MIPFRNNVVPMRPDFNENNAIDPWLGYIAARKSADYYLNKYVTLRYRGDARPEQHTRGIENGNGQRAYYS